MAVAVLQELPEMVTVEMYDAVGKEMGDAGASAPGNIIHTGGVTPSGVIRVYDVWESVEDWERFRDNVLGPAVQKVSGGQPPGEPRTEVYELHDVQQP